MIYHFRKGIAWFLQYIVGTTLTLMLLISIALYNWIEPDPKEKYIL